jgi:hypothetical protein
VENKSSIHAAPNKSRGKTDGSVARLSETIPPEIIKAMLTIARGEKLDKEEMRRKGWLR